MDGAVHVEAVRVLRPDDLARLLQRRERHHTAVVVPHVELRDVVRGGSFAGLGLQEHAPLSPESIELIDVEAAEKRLHRLVDVGQRDPLFQNLVAVDVGE